MPDAVRTPVETADALVHAAKVSTGVAAGILGLGFLATLGLHESANTGRREDEEPDGAARSLPLSDRRSS